MQVYLKFWLICKLYSVLDNLKPRGAACIKSGVASLRRFWCGMGGRKLESCVEVCGHKMGVKIAGFHTIWPFLGSDPHTKGI